VTRARLGPGVVLAATLAGFAVAHALDYTLVFPEPAERAAVLARTGHSYLPALGAIGWPLLGLAGAGALAAGLRRRSGGVSPRAAVALLAAAQAAFFVAAEVGERVGAHEPVADLVRTPLLFLGLAAQVVVAALLVMLLATVDAAGRRWSPLAPAPLPRLAVAAVPVPYVTSLCPVRPAGRAGARAPPYR
jgi:hypothetical protein